MSLLAHRCSAVLPPPSAKLASARTTMPLPIGIPSDRERTSCVWPPEAAHKRGVNMSPLHTPVLLFSPPSRYLATALTGALASSSSLTHSPCPFWQALCSAVLPVFTFWSPTCALHSSSIPTVLT
eukprot:CAMPEP_0114165326 /NCGR_PEP_ID=MMETSP0043_2-20121206/31190_1 /TAXON_ID=464988 /ORGANISM="Hemiselmis andersenii, Strain CCMP644" /LENGTH=124 /DNA_ID=CAMNT_0001262143 /DNA_START=151 /DNA_END=522 /DNA_ORIENTATION=-